MIPRKELEFLFDRHAKYGWSGDAFAVGLGDFIKAIYEITENWFKFPNEVPPSDADYFWISLANGHRSLATYAWDRGVFKDLSGFDFQHGLVTHFMPIAKPELPT
jgi:hypothetical protein